jgi:hypothetical protein
MLTGALTSHSLLVSLEVVSERRPGIHGPIARCGRSPQLLSIGTTRGGDDGLEGMSRARMARDLTVAL